MLSKEIINFADHLADLSAVIAKEYFRLPHGEILKDDDTPVTKADREIEKKLREEIEKNFPTHGIIGEEFGNHNEDADFKWILDPIDGTSSFIIGRPLFGTLIALSYKGKSLLGIMNQPITNERWLGIEEKGSWLNGKKIETRKTCRELSDAVMCTTSPFYFRGAENEKIFQKIASKTKYQSFGGAIYGGDCYLYAMLATGFVDLVIDPGLKVYDYAALVPIIKMAGGIVTDWEGKDLGLNSGVKMLAAANKEIHQKALEAINL